MACPKCGAVMGIIDGIYRCSNILVCGKISSIQPIPDQTKLLEEIEQLKAKIKELEDGHATT